MSNQTRSQKVVHVMRVLSSVPGGAEFELVSKKYPNLTPAEAMRGYEEQTQLYALEEIHRATVPSDAEQISVILHGTMPAGEPGPTVAARDLLFDNGLSAEWGFRAIVCDDRRFSLEVFPDDARPPIAHS